MLSGRFIISRIHVWLTRCFRCRGFGIQSPNDYAFVCDVVNEHRPYYAYRQLKKEHAALDAFSRKKFELYLRVANFRQPHLVIDKMPDSEVCHDYMRAGCAGSRLLTEDKEVMDISAQADVIRCPIDDVLSWVADGKLSQGVVLLVEPRYRHSLSSKTWRQLVEEIPYGVCFNLFYCGIIIFDKKRYKQNYIINF